MAIRWTCSPGSLRRSSGVFDVHLRLLVEEGERWTVTVALNPDPTWPLDGEDGEEEP